MHPLIIGLLIALGLLAFILILTMIVGFALMGSSKAIVKQLDSQNTEKVRKLLPDSDCGECGYSDCRACAKALCHREVTSTVCTKSSEDAKASIDALLNQLETPEELPADLRERKRFLRNRSADQEKK